MVHAKWMTAKVHVTARMEVSVGVVRTRMEASMMRESSWKARTALPIMREEGRTASWYTMM